MASGVATGPILGRAKPMSITRHRIASSFARPSMRGTTSSAILPILSVALLLIGAPAHANDADTLKGVRSLIVLIEDVAPEAKDDGLTVEELRSEVESQLRDAGLQIRGDATESLYIN